METFFALLALCVGNSPVTGEFPSQRPATRSLVVFFDLRLNKWLSNQSWGWWYETQSRSLWRHCNGAAHTGKAPLFCLNNWYISAVSDIWQKYVYSVTRFLHWHSISVHNTMLSMPSGEWCCWNYFVELDTIFAEWKVRIKNLNCLQNLQLFQSEPASDD